MPDIDTSPAALRALAESLITPRLGETATVHFKALSMVKAADFLRALAAEKEFATDVTDALKSCLNYIENTESELGIRLTCGDAARSALAKAESQS